MGGKSTKSERKYSENFDAVVSIPADIYSHFSDVHVAENPKMKFGAFIELMLNKKKDEKAAIDPTTEIKTSIFTILQCLFPKKTNYLDALKQDEILHKSNIILPKQIFSKILSSDDNDFAAKKKSSDSRSVLSARIETSSSASSRLSKKSSKSNKDISEKLNESLSKIVSPYRFKLIVILKELLFNQTQFESAQRRLGIQSAELLYDYIFSIIHAVLKDTKNITQRSTIEIVSEESIRLVNDSNHSNNEQSTIITLYQLELDQLSDEAPVNTTLANRVQFYGRMFSTLRSETGFFKQFFDSSRTQPQVFTDLSYELSEQSISIFEELFNECLSDDCNYVIALIRQICQSIETEAEMAAYYHLLGQLVFEVVLNKKGVNTFLSSYYAQQDLINNINNLLERTISDEYTMPEIPPETKVDFLECFAVLFKEFPRQALMLKDNEIKFKNIVRRPENTTICSHLNAEAMRIRLEIREREQLVSRNSKVPATILEETPSQASTPIKPSEENVRSPLASSISKALSFGDDHPPIPQATPTGDAPEVEEKTSSLTLA